MEGVPWSAARLLEVQVVAFCLGALALIVNDQATARCLVQLSVVCFMPWIPVPA
jgi:hypothetical protein